jgi:hypothetical protein
VSSYLGRPRVRLVEAVATWVATRLDLKGAFKNRFKFEIGSGAGIRTLNLAVNSRLLYR